jgi:uracil-DNA glycosylase
MLEREAAASAKRAPLNVVPPWRTPSSRAGRARWPSSTSAASPPLSPGTDRAVLGDGLVGAAIVSVGEQPGDQEEREAGRSSDQLFDLALTEAGIDRAGAYLTNAVKHFKSEPRGKKRLHKRPNPGEVKRYHWWLHKAFPFIRPRLVAALGNTALPDLTGELQSVMKARRPLPLAGFSAYATMHPSYLLRLPDEAARQAAWRVPRRPGACRKRRRLARSRQAVASRRHGCRPGHRADCSQLERAAISFWRGWPTVWTR